MSDVTTPAAVPAVPSLRAQLARVSHDAVLRVGDVVALDAGRAGLRATVEGGERIPGVVASERPDGRLAVELYLVARPVPLQALADRLRSAVERAASAAGIRDELGPIDISFEDVAEVTPPVEVP